MLVNGREAGVLLAPPWRVRIGHLLKRGRNRLEIEVASTLGNHYRTLPTRYRGPIEAGLIGPVVVESEALDAGEGARAPVGRGRPRSG